MTEHSSSMSPTIKAGDELELDKNAKCCRRGDIVAFNPGKSNSGNGFFIYRVIALPGETITACAATHVCVDGVQLKEPYLPKGTPTRLGGSLPRAYIDPAAPPQLVCEPRSPEGGCTVPSGKVFVMGDNRANSRDSRVEGPVRMRWIAGTLHPSRT